MAKSAKSPNTEKTPKTTTSEPQVPRRRRSGAVSAATSAVNDTQKSRVPKANAPWVPPADEVALRAYELYVERGRVHGHDIEDWAEAERQVRARYGR